MPQREENLAKTTWILVRDGVEQGIFTLQQLHDLTFSGHLLPLDLLREAGSKELLPAWRVRGSNRGPGESKTPHPWVPKAVTACHSGLCVGKKPRHHAVRVAPTGFNCIQELRD